MLPTFSFLYDVNALALLQAGLLAFLLAVVVAAVVDGQHRSQVVDSIALVALAALVRLALNHHALIRVSHPTINIGLTDNPQFFFYIDYPVALSGLTTLMDSLLPARMDEFDLTMAEILVVGCLTPAAFYLLSRLLGADRGVAWLVGLLIVFNPTHVLYSTHYDFFATSVFFEVVAHSLLILFLRTGQPVTFAGFFMASAVFYHSRPENSAIFYFHLACLLYAIWRLPLPRVRTVPLTLGFAAFNLAYHFDWLRNIHPNHVITNLWKAPWRIFGVIFDPEWNHLLDWRWSPPYVLLLVVLGVWVALRKPTAVHLYALAILCSYFAIYHDLMVPSPLHNSRFFLNLMPATAVLSLTALQWLQARWSRTVPAAAAVIVLLFLPYVSELRDFDTIQSQEFRFFRSQVAPTVKGGTLWRQEVTSALFEQLPEQAHDFFREGAVNEFEDGYLDRPDIQTVHRPRDVPTGGWLFLGASCYQLTAVSGQMTPQCAAQLQDPHNRIVKQSDAFAPRLYHLGAPWSITGAWKGFDSVRFYLLRRS